MQVSVSTSNLRLKVHQDKPGSINNLLISVRRALEDACNDLEREAQRKAERLLLKEKQKMQKEVDALQKGKQQAEEEKRLAEEAKLTAEEVRVIADEERDQAGKVREEIQAEIQENHDATINELVKHFTKKQRPDSDNESDVNGLPQP